MGVKTLNITYDEREFNKLSAEKESCEKARKQRLSWEDFIYLKITGKTI